MAALVVAIGGLFLCHRRQLFWILCLRLLFILCGIVLDRRVFLYILLIGHYWLVRLVSLLIWLKRLVWLVGLICLWWWYIHWWRVRISVCRCGAYDNEDCYTNDKHNPKHRRGLSIYNWQEKQ